MQSATELEVIQIDDEWWWDSGLAMLFGIIAPGGNDDLPLVDAKLSEETDDLVA